MGIFIFEILKFSSYLENLIQNKNMFVLSRDVSAASRVIATLLATAVVLWTLGFQLTAQAANITNVSDTLSDSDLGADADHTIVFDTVTDIQIGETITVTFPNAATEFDLTGVTAADFDISDAANWTEGIVGDTITFTRTNSILAGGTTVTININGTNKINNPTVIGSYEIVIAGTMTDSGRTRVAILDTVLVTANVPTVFNFNVYGNGAGEPINGTTTTQVSSSTTIPFGTLTQWQIETLSQDLTVETNAANGFVVTVETDGEFRSSTGAEIDGFQDNSDTNVPTTWTQPANDDISDPTRWGHWGITTEDNDTDGMRDGDEFAANEWIAATTTPRAIFAHDGPADAVTPNIGSTTVGFQVAISPLQEAGDDYQTTLTYIATPTF